MIYPYNKIEHIPEEILGVLPLKFADYGKSLVATGLMHNVLELRLNDKHFILKLYRDVADKGEFALSRELAGYQIAREQGLPVPRLCEQSSRPAYLLMEAAEGVNLKSILTDDSVEGYKKDGLVGRLCDCIGMLHSRKGESCSPPEYFGRLMGLLDNLYSNLGPSAIPEEQRRVIDHAMIDIKKRGGAFTSQISLSFVHSDLNPFNIIVKPDISDISAFVDWEKSHFGHPLEDIGKMLRHPFFGFSEKIKDCYGRRMGEVDERQLEFFKGFSNLEFVLLYSLARDNHNFASRSKTALYEQLFENHLRAVAAFSS